MSAEAIYFSYTELWMAWDGAEIGAFSLQDGTPMPPMLSVELFTDGWLPQRDPSARCVWTGLIGSADPDPRGLWGGFWLTMSTLDSSCQDCAGVEEALTAPRWIGLGPLEGSQIEVVGEVFADNGADWKEWRPATASLWAEIPQREGTLDVQAGYALAYPLTDGVMAEGADGYAPMVLQDDLPVGAIHALGMYSFPAEPLLADYRE